MTTCAATSSALPILWRTHTYVCYECYQRLCVFVWMQLYKKAKAKGYSEQDIAAVYKAANL